MILTRDELHATVSGLSDCEIAADFGCRFSYRRDKATIGPELAFVVAHGGLGTAWSSGAQVAVHRGADRWSIELRLPIVGEDAFTLDPAKGIAGAQPKELFPWHFNLCRQRIRDGKLERTAYSPTGQDHFRVPEKFSKLWGK